MLIIKHIKAISETAKQLKKLIKQETSITVNLRPIKTGSLANRYTLYIKSKEQATRAHRAKIQDVLKAQGFVWESYGEYKNFDNSYFLNWNGSQELNFCKLDTQHLRDELVKYEQALTAQETGISDSKTQMRIRIFDKRIERLKQLLSL